MNASEVKELFAEVVNGAISTAKPPKLEPYKGHPSQDLGKWLEDYDFLARTQGWDDKVKLKKLPLYLTDSAQDWYRLNVPVSSSADPNAPSYTAIIDDLISFFTPTNYKSYLREQLQRRVQGKGEPVANYILAKKALCIRLKPGMKDDKLMEKVYEGMLKPIARAVFQLKPGSLSELIDTAKTVEASESLGAELSDPKVRESDTGLKELLRGMKELFIEVREPRGQTAAASSKSPSNRATRDNESKKVSFDLPPQRNETRTRDGTPRCYNCGRVGHIARNCRFASNNTQGHSPNYKSSNAIVQTLADLDAKKSSLIYLPVFISELIREALIDTGSDVSFINSQVIDTKVMVLPYKGPNVKSVSGEIIAILGIVTIPIKYDTSKGMKTIEQSFIVTNDFEFEVLLGNDFHRATGLFVHPKSNSVGFMDENDILPLILSNVQAKTELCVGKISLSTGKDHRKPLHVSLEKEIEPPKSDSMHRVWTDTCYSIGSDPEKASNIVKKPFGPGVLLFGANLSETQSSELLQMLQQFRESFTFPGDALGKCNVSMMRINTGDAEPIKQRPYRKSFADREEEQRQIDELLAAGIIRHSRSPWASPTLLVDKKGGKRRLCVNYIKLNKVTKKDAFPIPDCKDLLDHFQGARIFSSFDLKSGYHQMMIHPDDQEKTALITQDGLYEYIFVPFGLCDAPSEFQRLMSYILRELLRKICVVYIDDIVVYSPDYESHKIHLHMVLTAIRDAGMTFNPEKCVIAVDIISFLGYICDPEGIKMNPARVLAVRDFPRPKHITNVKQFTGMASFYRRFIENYGKLEEHLTRLSRKDTPYFWLDDQEQAFNLIKEKLCEYPVLATFDRTKECELRCDASGIGLGAVMVQKHDKKYRPLCYLSRKLSDAETRYSTTDKEALCIVWALDKLKTWTKSYPVNVVTDHKPLTYLQSKDRDKLPNRLQKYAIELEKYHCVKIIYKQGKLNLDADALSRNPVSEPEETDNKLEFMCLAALHEKENIPDIRAKQLADSNWTNIIESIETTGQYKGPRNVNYGLINGVLFREIERNTGKSLVLCVPKGMYEAILMAYHDDPIGGHFGVTKTIGRLAERFYWPSMKVYVKEYIKSCRDCQTRKREFAKPSGLLKSIEVGMPFDMVSIDLLGPFKKTDSGNRHVIVATDCFTRYVIAKAVPSATAFEVAKFLVDSILLVHGSPYKLLSDRGKCFLSKVCEGIYELMATQKVYTTAYHPQCNGLTESFNKVLATQMSFYVSADQKDWDRFVPLAVFSYNTSISSATTLTPFYLMYNRRVRLPADTNFEIPNVRREDMDYAAEMKLRVQEAREIAQKAIAASQARSARYYNAKRREVEFEIGDLVMHYTPKRIIGLSTKLLHRWRGPFEIVEKMSDLNYRIASISGRSHTEVVNVNSLKPFYGRDFLARLDEPAEKEIVVEIRAEPMTQIAEPAYCADKQEQGADQMSNNENTDEPPVLELVEDIVEARESLVMPEIDLMVPNANKEADEQVNECPTQLNEPVDTSCAEKPISSPPSPRRSSRVHKSPAKLSYAAIVALSIITVVSCSFQRTNPILWRNSDVKVVAGISKVNAVINYESPCIVFNDEFYSRWRPYTFRLRSWCDAMFEEDFVKQVESFCDSPPAANIGTTALGRPKRLVLLTAAVVTTLVVTVATTVGIASAALIKEAKLSSEVQSIRNEQAEAMRHLHLERNRLEQVVEVVRTLEQTVEDIGSAVKQIDAKIKTMIENNPENWTFIANLATRMGLLKDRFQDIARDWHNGHFNPKLLDIFNVTLPCSESCPVKLFKPRNCHVDRLRKLILFNFDARSVKASSTVLKADTFRLFTKTKNGTELCSIEYKGPQAVIYDHELDCVTPVTHAMKSADNLLLTPTVEYCSTNAPQNTTERYWKQTQCEELDKITEEDQIQVKASNDFNYVYCPSFSITVFNRTLACPSFVFSLPYFNSFSVGRLKFGAEQIRLQSNLDIIPSYSHRVNFHMLPSLHEFKFESELNSTKGKLLALEAEPAEPVTDMASGYDFMTVVAAFVIGMLLMCLSYLCYHQYRCRRINRNKLVISRQRYIKGQDDELNELNYTEDSDKEAEPEGQTSKAKSTVPKKLVLLATLLCISSPSFAAPTCPRHLTFVIVYDSLCVELSSVNSSQWCQNQFLDSFVTPISKLCAPSEDTLVVGRTLFRQSRSKRSEVGREDTVVSRIGEVIFDHKSSNISQTVRESVVAHELAVRFPIIRTKIHEIVRDWKAHKLSSELVQLLGIEEYFVSCNHNQYAPHFCLIDKKGKTIILHIDRNFMPSLAFLAKIAWYLPVILTSLAFFATFTALRASKARNRLINNSRFREISRPAQLADEPFRDIGPIF